MSKLVEPIERKTMYRVSFTYLTIDGNASAGTIWYNSIIDIPNKYFSEDNARLWERSFDVFAKPTRAQFKEAKRTGNKYWLNTNQTIKEIF